MADTSVSKKTAISESRKAIAGEFLDLANESYERQATGLKRAIGLALKYGWTVAEITDRLDVDRHEIMTLSEGRQ